MIFVDTGAWYASVVRNDDDHHAAHDWLEQNGEPLVTTDFIIDETLTLLKMRGHATIALKIGHELFGRELAEIVMITEQDIQEAWKIFRNYTDKGWSFTDCTSKAVIERLGIQNAFAFDLHVRQFGTVNVVP